MSLYYTETELVARVDRLTPRRLRRFVEAQFVLPMDRDGRPVYRDMDCARLELLCELSDEFEMNEDALDMVMALVDQLHGIRAELRAMTTALAAEPEDVRRRLIDAVCAARSAGKP